MNMLKRMRIYLINHTAFNRLAVFITFVVVSIINGGQILLAIFFAYIVHFLLNPTRIKSGSFTISNHEYKYFYGDRLHIAGETVNGIQIELPAYLPHIFVDLHSNNGVFGVQRRFTDIKKYELEGDFGTNTNVFARLKDRIEVLIVLNPNTMRVLLDVSKQYDFECISNRLMLYSRKKMYDYPQHSMQITQAAQAVVGSLHQTLLYSEILHKKQTQAMSVVPDDRYITFGKYGVGSARKIVALLVALLVSVGFYVGVMGTYNAAESIKDQVVPLRIALVVLWLLVTVPIIYLGFSRKKIDIR